MPLTRPRHRRSTIVSRERSIAKAAFIGIFWGVGHTLTILGGRRRNFLFGLANSRSRRTHYGILRRANADPPGRAES